MCEVCEEHVRVCEGVCENALMYNKWLSQHKYELSDTQLVKLPEKRPKYLEVGEKCVRVCEMV